jgi:hypothetical protein
MRNWIIVIAVVVGGIAALVAPAHAELAPAKASQLVTLLSRPGCPVDATADVVDQLHAADGSVVTFSGPPSRQVLVITGVTFNSGPGINPGESVHMQLARVGSSSVNYVTSLRTTANADGTAAANVQIPLGAAVSSGVTLCVCAQAPTGCKPGGLHWVHGYLAPDK